MLTIDTGPARGYVLNDGVRVFRSGHEIRFRKGVWSYNEATLRLDGQAGGIVRFFEAVYQALLPGPGARVDPLLLGRQLSVPRDQLEASTAVLESLRQQQFLRDAGEPGAVQSLRALMGGSLSGFEEYAGAARPVLFFTDSPYVREVVGTLARQIGLPLDLMAEDTLAELARADLTSRIDAVTHADALAEFERHFVPYACVLGTVADPNLSLLRNLNRVLIRAEKPLILGLVDGPFATLLSTLAPSSGCFECYEQRMLARLQDTLVYHEFVTATADAPAGGAAFAPTLHMLTAGVLAEGFLYASLNTLRLAGRLVTIYQPLLEIQVQDLLRVPYCPACGFIAKAQMNEMYTSTRRIVQELLDKVEIRES